MTQSIDERLVPVLEVIEEIELESTTPKNVRQALITLKSILTEEKELSINVNKALSVLEELETDNNMQSYTRTQIWNLVSALEML
ncbi:hypothetical protein GOV04_04940 [Candidatus Woesearchaeota archaeon]|nr:hypothetical protein [Candidatus Woesearchaeota archaeon]